MRAVLLENISVGDILGKSLFNQRSELLLAAGFEITEEILQSLHRHGFKQIYIHEEDQIEITPQDVISDIVRQAVSQNLNEEFNSLKERLKKLPSSPIQIKKRLQNDVELKNMISIEEVSRSSNMLLEEILQNNLSILSSLPVKSQSSQSFQHAMDVAVLCVFIGQFFHYDHQELASLGTAALMHDVGKIAFQGMENKPIYEMKFQDRWLLREHPTYSNLILKGSDPHSYVEQTTVLEHHERPDGKGFPQGLKSRNSAPIKGRSNDSGYIFRHAEILSVANAYDNYISGDIDGKIYSPQGAISEMVTQAGTAFNPHVLKALTKVVQFYPAGSIIRILNTYSGKYVGFKALVKNANPKEYAKPVVILTHDEFDQEIEHEEVDLRNERAVYLELVL